MRIRSKEEVVKTYKNRYPELDQYFIANLKQEYDRYYEKLKDMTGENEIRDFFAKEIEKNEQNYKGGTHVEGVNASLHNHYMSVLANYGLIVFFRDNMIEWD